jgi:hypothetical protein
LEIEGMRKRDCGMVKDKQKDSINGTKVAWMGSKCFGEWGRGKKSPSIIVLKVCSS